MRIEIDNLERQQVLALLEEHLQDMYATSPPESVHALDVSKLKLPSITFWTGWDGEQLLGGNEPTRRWSRRVEIDAYDAIGEKTGRGIPLTQSRD